MSDTIESNEITRLVKMLDSINARLSAIEATINLPKSERSDLDEQEVIPFTKESSEDLEFRLGEQWFGKIGIIAFLLAVFNFLVLPFESIPQSIILILGFIISFILITSSIAGAKMLKNLAGYTLGSGLILLFVSALRLHFFTSAPFLTSKVVLIILLFIVTGISLVILIKKRICFFNNFSINIFL